MPHALAVFIQQRMEDRKLRNRDVVRDSGLSRALVSKYVNDQRETLSRLPERETLEGLAKAFGVSLEFLFGKAIESMGLGYTSGDFVNGVATASNRELLDEISQRLRPEGDAANAQDSGRSGGLSLVPETEVAALETGDDDLPPGHDEPSD